MGFPKLVDGTPLRQGASYVHMSAISSCGGPGLIEDTAISLGKRNGADYLLVVRGDG